MRTIIRKMCLGDVIKEEERDLPFLPEKGDMIMFCGDTWKVTQRIFDVSNNKMYIYVK